MARRHFKIDQHVADMAAFIGALNAGPVRLIGHSRGGHIAFRLAELHPQLDQPAGAGRARRRAG